MVCQGSDRAAHEDVVHCIPAVNSSFGLDIPGKDNIKHIRTFYTNRALPGHVIPVSVSKLLQAIKKLDEFIGRPVVVQGREVPVVHEPVAVMGLVTTDLYPSGEALRTEGEAGLSALDPDQAGHVNVISAARALVLGAEVPGHNEPSIQTSAGAQRRVTVGLRVNPRSYSQLVKRKGRL